MYDKTLSSFKVLDSKSSSMISSCFLYHGYSIVLFEVTCSAM